ncbi:MAG: FAD-dependent oxidoreductase, partial [Archangium sp.]|nr:FAD-dependent oxidoreductase [Archangium sp.]
MDALHAVSNRACAGVPAALVARRARPARLRQSACRSAHGHRLRRHSRGHRGAAVRRVLEARARAAERKALAGALGAAHPEPDRARSPDAHSPTRGAQVKRVAVIGGGIGGLTAAGMLARKGHRVTLFEATGSLGGKAGTLRVDGLVFDTGPTVMTMPDTVRATFADLGAEDLMPRLARLPLQTHYRYADGREFLCWEDLDRAAESAAALHPADGDGLRSFFADAQRVYRAAGQPYLDAPYETMMGFMARAARNGLGTLVTGLKLSTLDALGQKHFESQHLQQFVNRFATYAGASPYEANAAFAMIAHIERAFGVHHAIG